MSKVALDCVLDIIKNKPVDGFFSKRRWNKYSKKIFLVLMPAKSLKKTIASKYFLSQNIMIYLVNDMVSNLIYGKDSLISHIEFLKTNDYRMYKATIYNIAMTYLKSVKHTASGKASKIILLHDDIGIANHLRIPEKNIIKAMPGEALFENIKETMEDEGSTLNGSELEKVIMERSVLKQDSETKVFNFIEDFVGILSELTGMGEELSKFAEF